MRLLLIEDDAIVGSGLRSWLRCEGHVVEWCERLAHVRAWQAEPFDALLVDWQLPDGSGVAWLQSRRREGSTIPAIVLTARDQLHDRILGLDAGADDYLVKPFDPEELAARLRAVQRRHLGLPQDRVAAAGAEVDLAARCAWCDGTSVALTAREWAVLEALTLRAGRFVNKTDLESLVLGFDGEACSNALEVHVSSLRRKIGRRAIETMRGRGYRLVPATEP